MIGLMNVPSESPTEFYGSNPKLATKEHQIDLENSSENNKVEKEGSKNRDDRLRHLSSILGHRKPSMDMQLKYLPDGRKITLESDLNGTSKHLWQELLIRCFLQELGDKAKRGDENQLCSNEQALVHSRPINGLNDGSRSKNNKSNAEKDASKDGKKIHSKERRNSG